MNRKRIRRPRKPSSLQQRREWVERFEQSGLTPAKFARRNKLDQSTLCVWRRQVRDEQMLRADSQGLVPTGELPLREVPLSAVLGTSSWGAELQLPSGAVLRLAAPVPPQVWQTLLSRLVC